MGAPPNCASKAKTLVSEGYLSALVGNLDELPQYWQGMLHDFPGHVVKDTDVNLRASIGCTLYGAMSKVRSFFNFISPKNHEPSKTRKPNLLYLHCLNPKKEMKWIACGIRGCSFFGRRITRHAEHIAQAHDFRWLYFHHLFMPLTQKPG